MGITFLTGKSVRRAFWMSASLKACHVGGNEEGDGLGELPGWRIHCGDR